jgi:hypothetical protein
MIVLMERKREFWRTFAVLGEDDDLGQTGMKEKKEKYVADRAIREREKKVVQYSTAERAF